MPPSHGPLPSKPRGRWGTLLVFAVVAVGILVVVAAVTILNSPRTVYGSPFSFASFYDPATASGTAVPGGPWTPVAAFGVAVSADERGVLGAEALGGADCSPVWSASSSPQLLATPAGAGPGEVSAWFLFSTNSSGYALLTIAQNTSGLVQAVGLAVVPEACLVGIGGYAALNGTIVDSPVAAAAADPAGGLSFLSAHGGATQEFIVADNTWTVVYSTCPFSGSSGTGYEFLASVSALSGALLQAQTLSSVPCTT